MSAISTSTPSPFGFLGVTARPPLCSFDVTLSVGAWAVNVLTVESPGFMFLMATSADIKVTLHTRQTGAESGAPAKVNSNLMFLFYRCRRARYFGLVCDFVLCIEIAEIDLWWLARNDYEQLLSTRRYERL